MCRRFIIRAARQENPERLAILFAISGGPHFAALLANEIVEFYGAKDNDERFERETGKSDEDS